MQYDNKTDLSHLDWTIIEMALRTALEDVKNFLAVDLDQATREHSEHTAAAILAEIEKVRTLVSKTK